jgi:hypothetical protein
VNKTPGTCKIEGCGEDVVARGWCRRHYARWHTTGDPGPAGLKRLPDHAPCSVDGCDKPNFANGYCEMHRWRVRFHGDPGQAGQMKRGRKPGEAQAPRKGKERLPCPIEGCDRPRLGKFYCKLHYERIRRTGEPGPANPTRAKGTGTIMKEGYRRIHVEGGRRVLEHVYVMEQHLGRRLVPGENVHHKHGMRSENKIEDLELWLVMQPSGQRVADLMEYIAEYHAGAMRDLLDRREPLG